MIKFLKFVLFLSMISVSQNFVKAQSTDTSYTIKAVLDAGNSTVKIRFAPNNYKTMELGYQHGLALYRRKIAQNGVELSFEQSLLTDSKIAEIRPFSSSQLNNSNIASLPIKNTIDSLLYYQKLIYELPDTPKFGDAVKLHESMYERYLLRLLIADQDFKYAVALGLGYRDTILNCNFCGDKYLYSLKFDSLPLLKDTSLILGTYIQTITFDSSSVAAPDSVHGEAGNKIARIYWDAKSHEDTYTFYNIYRKEVGGVYEKRNANPYVFMHDVNYSGLAHFTDTLAQNGLAYTYQIKGINVGGDEGLPSEEVVVIGRPDSLNVNVVIDSFAIILNNSLALKWKVEEFFSEDSIMVLQSIDEFEFYYGASREVTPTLVNSTSAIGAEIRQTIVPFLGDGYYYLKMTDINGYSYMSVPKLIQKLDTIPPTSPTGVVATINSDGNITLKWAVNTETDLLGYKIYEAYKQDGPYIEITDRFLTKNEFRKTISSENINSFGYYKVKAFDKAENASSMSEDTAYVVFPSNSVLEAPLLTHAFPHPGGIRIGWQLNTKLPYTYILQRKLKSASQWQDLVNFKEVQLYPALPIVQNELAPSNYIDTDTLEFKYYNYRLKAVNEAGKYTYSKMVQVKPYDNGIRGQIQNFTGTVLPSNQYYTDFYIPPFVDANQGSVVQKKPEGSVIRLQWGYNTAYTASLREFKIYVKDNVPANMTDGGLSGKYTLVKTVKKGVAASTAQAIGVSNYAVHVDRLNYILSMAKKVKIVAFHNDGGFSEVAEILVNP